MGLQAESVRVGLNCRTPAGVGELLGGLEQNTHQRHGLGVLPRRGAEEEVALEWGQGGQRRLGEESFQTERGGGSQKRGGRRGKGHSLRC